MRYIQKGAEPQSLIRYKKEANAYYDGFDKKDEIRESLLKEQGHLCGYCMRRLESCADVKIEHIVSQSSLKENERAALDYRIMLGVCNGNAGKPRRQQTCDTHRGNDDLKINPFNQTLMNMVKYKSDGTIYSNDPDINKDLDITLNLNYNGENAYLKLNRKEALAVCKNRLTKLQKDGNWKKNVILRILKEYETPDEEGRLIPYSGIVVDYLKKRLKRK